MIGLIAAGLAYVIVHQLEKASEYREPKGKDKNRYK
jgi:high-affinity Fe2+/Pb2+ permease